MKDRFSIPELSLVVLIGASGSGKSTFARKHFRGTEIISSDYCRALVADDENDLSVTDDAFEILHFIAGKRLRAGRLAVVDATNVKPEDRAAGRIGSAISLFARCNCLERSRTDLPREEPGPDRPAAWESCRASAASESSAFAAWSGTRRIPARSYSQHGRGGRGNRS